MFMLYSISHYVYFIFNKLSRNSNYFSFFNANIFHVLHFPGIQSVFRNRINLFKKTTVHCSKPIYLEKHNLYFFSDVFNFLLFGKNDVRNTLTDYLLILLSNSLVFLHQQKFLKFLKYSSINMLI